MLSMRPVFPPISQSHGHASTRETRTEHLLYARPCGRHWDMSGEGELAAGRDSGLVKTSEVGVPWVMTDTCAEPSGDPEEGKGAIF